MTWGRGSTRQSRRDRDIILERDPICRCDGCPECTPAGCGRPSTQDDHIIPVHQGGTDALSNRRGLCLPCHEVKSKAERAAARHRVRRQRQPEQHPGVGPP